MGDSWVTTLDILPPEMVEYAPIKDNKVFMPRIIPKLNAQRRPRHAYAPMNLKGR